LQTFEGGRLASSTASHPGAHDHGSPLHPSDLSAVYQEFGETIAPYSSGNVHPGFMGWVQGGSTAVGMLAEMLAAGLNANLGGRDHMPIAVEQQIVA